jgi:hypothetical protein
MEAVQKQLQIASGDTDHGHGFEPEVLAFCCEH